MNKTSILFQVGHQSIFDILRISLKIMFPRILLNTLQLLPFKMFSASCTTSSIPLHLRSSNTFHSGLPLSCQGHSCLRVFALALPFPGILFCVFMHPFLMSLNLCSVITFSVTTSLSSLVKTIVPLPWQFQSFFFN